jgi:hypothetical protein
LFLSLLDSAELATRFWNAQKRAKKNTANLKAKPPGDVGHRGVAFS